MLKLSFAVLCAAFLVAMGCDREPAQKPQTAPVGSVGVQSTSANMTATAPGIPPGLPSLPEPPRLPDPPRPPSIPGAPDPGVPRLPEPPAPKPGVPGAPDPGMPILPDPPATRPAPGGQAVQQP